MKLFREEKILKFDEKEVTVYEITAMELVKLTSGEYKKMRICLSIAPHLVKMSLKS